MHAPMPCLVLHTCCSSTWYNKYEQHELAVDNCIRGHHVFKNIWTPTLGKQLPCRREIGINKDRYAVAILRDRTMGGHVPRKISAACTLFLQREGSIHCVVTRKRCFHLPHKHKSPKTAATTQRPHLLISTMNEFLLADFNLVVSWSMRQPPNLIPHQIFRLYGSSVYKTHQDIFVVQIQRAEKQMDVVSCCFPCSTSQAWRILVQGNIGAVSPSLSEGYILMSGTE